jgi:phage FluMu protein Com
MSYKFPNTCPKDGQQYSNVKLLAEHILKAHVTTKCPKCRTELAADLIDSWVHTCHEHNVPEYEFFIRCKRCNWELTLLSHTYDSRGIVVHFVEPRI